MFYSYSAIYAREYATVQYKYIFAGMSWNLSKKWIIVVQQDAKCEKYM